MKFVDVNGLLRRARRFVSASGSVQSKDVEDSQKLAEILRNVEKRLTDLEVRTAPEAIEFEVNVSAGGTQLTIAHNLSCPVRWYVVQWTGVPGATVPIAGPQLVHQASSTAKVLILKSYVAGKAVVRIEPSFAEVAR